MGELQLGVKIKAIRVIMLWNLFACPNFSYNITSSQVLGKSFITIIQLINSLPTPLLNNLSLFEKLFDKKPPYDILRVFDCLCFLFTKPYN